MHQPEQLFQSICEKLTKTNSDIELGKMMSAPGLKYCSKVFAFYNRQSMGFRLGPDFDPETFGLQNAKLLSPFKKKPPLKGWYIIDYSESKKWHTLSELALEFTMTLK